MFVVCTILDITSHNCRHLSNGVNAIVVRPTMPETTALGAAMVAGAAKGIDVWNLNPDDKAQVTTDVFNPALHPEGTRNMRA